MGRIGFGQLSALNDETLAPGKGIPLHAHENMEIISIPLSGTLRHQDSRGAIHIIAPGHVHLLSAGRGITHWEYNHSAHDPVHYLQVWISPKSRMTPTSYTQAAIDAANTTNHVSLIAAPRASSGLVAIDQDAFVSLVTMGPDTELQYSKHLPTSGVYVFVIEGHVKVGADELTQSSGFGLVDAVIPAFQARERSTILCVETPI